MKRKYLVIPMFLVATLAGCKEKAIFKNFETSYSFKASIPANALISSPLFPAAFEQESNSSGQYEINDTRKDLIEEVYIQSFLLEVVSPQSDDLSFLNSARFYINASGEPEKLLAYKDPVPSDVGNDLLFDHDQVNLAPYLKKEPFEVRSKIVTDEYRSHDVVVKGTVKFKVKARVLDFE